MKFDGALLAESFAARFLTKHCEAAEVTLHDGSRRVAKRPILAVPYPRSDRRHLTTVTRQGSLRDTMCIAVRKHSR